MKKLIGAIALLSIITYTSGCDWMRNNPNQTMKIIKCMVESGVEVCKIVND